jgi:hypothetical protein
VRWRQTWPSSSSTFSVRKTPLNLLPHLSKNDQLTKTGSGQTQGSAE